MYFLFSSGSLGVAFFFILSGFLMGYLYANPQPKEFIERRYARIFPPFLVMAFSMWIFRLFPQTPLFARVVCMLFFAFFVRTVWTNLIERFHLGSLSIKIFLYIQLIIAVWYGFFIMRLPAAWFDSLPFILREGTIFATNVTFSLPFGNYIPLLDGVYWSLAPEVLFYLIYPFLFSPTVSQLKKKSSSFVLLFIVSLFPLFFGLSLLFKQTQGLGSLFIEYFIYFCGGITLANYILNKAKKSSPVFLRYIVNPVTFLIMLFVSFLFLQEASGATTLLFRLLLVVPFGYIVYSLVEEETLLSRLFRRREFLFLGTISYSMYIGHTAIVDGLHLLFRPKNLLTNVLFLSITTSIFLLVSYAFHLIIETPYFQFKPTKKIEYHRLNTSKLPYFAFFAFIASLFFSVYSSQFNFLSQQKKYKDIIPQSIVISDNSYSFSFKSQENNMGVILLHLTNIVGEKNVGKTSADPSKHQRFVIKMKEEGASQWYASQDSSPAEIGSSSSYPFGFPVIVDSINKKYVVELSMKDADYTSSILLNKDVYTITTVHQISKQTLVKNPLFFISHLGGKLQIVFTNPAAQLTALCISPFFLLLFFLLYA